MAEEEIVTNDEVLVLTPVMTAEEPEDFVTLTVIEQSDVLRLADTETSDRKLIVDPLVLIPVMQSVLAVCVTNNAVAV